MIKYLIRLFVRDYENVNDTSVRESYGVLAGVLGIACNLSLFILKLTIGLLINSIAVISDAFNNLTDLSSSVITVVSAKLSNRPPDHEHPHGHGRFEYIASLVVSFIMLAVGIQLLRSSIEKVLSPTEVVFSPLALALLTLSLGVKLWMFSYNRYIGEAINSSVNKTTAFDSLNDVVATSAVIVTMALASLIHLPIIDGIAGIAVSLLVLYTGYSTAKDTVGLILGASPSRELLDTIDTLVAQSQHVVGTHDPVVHDYGPGRVVASIHAEVPEDVSIAEAHAEIDELEHRIADELGITLLIHMDPISSAGNENNRITIPISDIIQGLNPGYSVRNVRVVHGENRSDVILDLLVPASVEESEYDEIRSSITEKVRSENGRYSVVISSIRARA